MNQVFTSQKALPWLALNFFDLIGSASGCFRFSPAVALVDVTDVDVTGDDVRSNDVPAVGSFGPMSKASFSFLKKSHIFSSFGAVEALLDLGGSSSPSNSC